MSQTLASCIATLCVAGLFATPAAAQAVVGFDAGPEGWSINGIDTVVPTGGNPDEHIRYPNPIDTFGISLRNSTNASFLGDYGALGDSTLSVDAKVEFISFFGSPVPRELVVILYDDDEQGPNGAAGVWTSLGVLDGNGMPWTNFSADLTDTTSAALPAGWNGLGDEDPGTFEPILPAGSTWASVLADVDRIEFTTFVPGFFFGFTNFDVRYDNVSLQPAASPWSDLGNGLAGVQGVPALAGAGTLTDGAVTTLSLTDGVPSGSAYLVISATNISAPFKGGVLVPNPDIVLSGLPLDAQGDLEISFHWPSGLPSGLATYWQYWLQDGAGVLGWSASNALQGTTP